MNQNWIKNAINNLGDLYEKCDEEKALKSYIVCVVRMLNGLSQMDQENFHRYEYKILAQPIEVFTEYLCNQIINTIQLEDVDEKKQYILDIENAVCCVIDIYENVINGTANTDKQMFMSFPLNSSVYKILPKLYAVYSDIINDLIEIFPPEESNSRYAFILNPTLKMTLQEELLFQKRQESGKVVVIHIPVRMLEDLDSVPLCLMHEIFHVLTKSERHRKQRAKYLLVTLISQVRIRLFQGIVFCEDNKDFDCYLKSKLSDIWFEEAIGRFQKKCAGKDKEDKLFYSINIQEYLNSLLQESLKDIENRIPQDILCYVSEEMDQKCHYGRKDYNKNISNLMLQIEKLKDNILIIHNQNIISYLITRLLYIFRECYADLACLLTSDYGMKKFEMAFNKATQFRLLDGQMDKDDYHKIRLRLMKMILEDDRSPGDHINGQGKDFIQVRYLEKYSRQNDERYVILDRYLILLSEKYLSDCKKDIEKILLRNQEKVAAFRKKIERYAEKQEKTLSRGLN